MITNTSKHNISQETCNAALLEALKIQAIRVPLIMIIVIVVMTGFALGKAPFWYIALWATFAILMQAVRSTIMYRLPSQMERTVDAKLRIAALLSLINGMVLASSALFFSDLDITSRAVFSMIMIGLVAGTIATSHGYRPIFLGFVVPVLGSVIFVWAFATDESLSSSKIGSIVFLVIALGGVLYASSRDVYGSFVDTFTVSAQLENALVAEKNANAAKTRFLAAASHDLRQPLHTLSLLSAALTLRDLDERSLTIAQRMNLTMADLSSELDSLLDISKLDASVVTIKLVEFDINTSISRLLSEYEPMAKTKGIVLVHKNNSTGTLVTDRFFFERLIRNLLDNAVKYTESGSIIVDVSQGSGSWSVSILDTGIGIPDHEQSKVWEEFYQLKNNERDRQKGLGLGLSIVLRLTSLLGGSIHMGSVLGQGTRFTIELPVISQSSSLSRTTQPIQKQLPLSRMEDVRGARVLVVDDDRALRSGTRLLLENCGLTVCEAAGTVEAVAALKKYDPHLVLCDLRLPGKDDGFNTIESLRGLDPEIPIIIVSAETFSNQMRHAKVSDIDYVTKPVDARHLLNKISYRLRTIQPEQSIREPHEAFS